MFFRGALTEPRLSGLATLTNTAPSDADRSVSISRCLDFIRSPVAIRGFFVFREGLTEPGL